MSSKLQLLWELPSAWYGFLPLPSMVVPGLLAVAELSARRQCQIRQPWQQ